MTRIYILLGIIAAMAAVIFSGGYNCHGPEQKKTAADITRSSDTTLTIGYTPQPLKTQRAAWRTAGQRTMIADTTIVFDSTATLTIRNDTIQHATTFGLQLSPIRHDTIHIRDTIKINTTTTLIEHDSFITRAGFIATGVAAVLIYEVVHAAIKR